MIVVVVSRGFNPGSGIVQRQEPVFVQTFRANSPVERFDERVIRRFSRHREIVAATEVESHFVGISPLVQSLRGELSAVVILDRFRKPTVLTDSIQSFDNFMTSQTLADDDRQTLTSKVIDYR